MTRHRTIVRLFATLPLALAAALAACSSQNVPDDAQPADVLTSDAQSGGDSSMDAAVADGASVDAARADAPASDAAGLDGAAADAPALDVRPGSDVVADAPPDAPRDASADVPSDVPSDVPAGGCTAAGGCGVGESCHLDACGPGVIGTCGTIGACPRIYRPECGCDGRTFSNNCERYNAGVGLAYAGACTSASDAGSDASADVPMDSSADTGADASTGADTGADTRTDTGADTGADASTGVDSGADVAACVVPVGGMCCSADSQCRSSHCVMAAACRPGETTTGVCKDAPTPGRCWEDRDCGGSGIVCIMQRVCACGQRCLLPDALGYCTP